MSAPDTLTDTQSSKAGKTEKSEPAVWWRKSPLQRKYEDVRSPKRWYVSTTSEQSHF